MSKTLEKFWNADDRYLELDNQISEAMGEHGVDAPEVDRLYGRLATVLVRLENLDNLLHAEWCAEEDQRNTAVRRVSAS